MEAHLKNSHAAVPSCSKLPRSLGILPQEGKSDQDRMAVRRPLYTKYSLQSSMFRAIGLAALLIVLTIFMPTVLSSMENFLQTLFETGTMILQNIQEPLRQHASLNGRVVFIF